MAQLPECQCWDDCVHYGPILCKDCAAALRAERDAARAENESLREALADVRAGWNKEAYKGLLLAVLIASTKKVRAGLKHTGSIELGTALDALDIIVRDITHFIELNDDATLDVTTPEGDCPICGQPEAEHSVEVTWDCPPG